MMYIEGIKDGERLIKVLKRATAQKPVVVIKSGRSVRGAMAAASHTGSLSGADEVFEDIIRQCGVLRAESIHEALEWCRFLSNAPRPKGENVKDLGFGASLHLDPISVAKHIKGQLIIVMKGVEGTIMDEAAFLKKCIDMSDIDFGGVIINQMHNIDDFKISKASGLNIPLLLVSADTFQVAKQIDDLEPLLTKDETGKIDTIEGLVREHVSFEGIFV